MALALGVGPELASGVIAVVGALRVAGAAMARGFPVDDAWIHMVYGLSLRTAGAFEYNDGIAGSGSTSPLWAVVAALAHGVAGAREPSFVAALVLKGFGIVAHAASAVLAARLSRACVPSPRLAVPAALAAGALVAACPALDYAAVSGMEVPLAGALMLAAFLLAARQRPVLTGIVSGLGMLARPEVIVVAPLVLALSLRASAAPRRGLRAVAAVGAALALPAVWSLRNLAYTGRPLSATIYAKASRAGSVVDSMRLALFEMLGKSRPMNRGVVLALVVAAAVLGVVAAAQALRARRHDAARDPALIAGAVALAGLAYVAGIAWHTRFFEPASFYYLRYLLPAVPLLLVAATSALAHLVSLVPRIESRPRLAVGLLTAAGLATAGWEVEAWDRRRARYEEDVASIDSVQVVVGQFIASAMPPGATVWSVDAGAPRYFGRRRLVDSVRLNTPELFAGDDVPASWAPEVLVLEVPYGYRARVDAGSLFTALEVPLDWKDRPLPEGWPQRMPTQRCSSVRRRAARSPSGEGRSSSPAGRAPCGSYQPTSKNRPRSGPNALRTR